MSVTNFRKASLKNGLPKSSDFADIPVTPVVNNIPISETSLLRYYSAQNTVSYPGTGTTWTDLKSSGYNLTLVNGPTYTAPSNSTTPGFFTFDGTNDYASGADTGMAAGASSRSIGGWIMTLTGVDGGTVFEYGTNGTQKAEWWQACVTGRTPSPAMGANMYGPWIPSGLNGTPVGVSTPLNTWVYFCITWDSNGDYAFNLNGADTRTGNQAGDVNTVLNGTMYLGSIAGSSGQHMKLGEIFYYTDKISAATNLANYNATKAQYGI